jgi:pyruvate,orthophosphate dikinase
VRSGAAQSMPGMLDTVLNLGIDDTVHHALAEEFSPSFAADTRDRFNRMYRHIVAPADGAVPEEPDEQLRAAIEAVFRSWNGDRAVAYRRHRGVDDLAGTAVVIQAMVFGNKNVRSGTGVLFSRDPRTGADTVFGEWLGGGQGEDVVSGTADVQPISVLADQLPETHAELMRAARTLEKATGDVQDIEFTVEDGRLWLLQTRAAKRSAQAAVRLALTMRREGLIDDLQALLRVGPEDVNTLLKPALQPETRLAAPLLAAGLAACPGVAVGVAYADVDDAIDAAERDEDVILVRTSTSPDDVAGMLSARGIVTEVGGATSHAAVVSRELGRPSVVGCGAGVVERLSGKLVTVDGSVGEIREGALQLTAWSESDSPDLRSLRDIASRFTTSTGDTGLAEMLTAIHRRHRSE